MAKNKCVKSVEKKTLTKADKKHRHHASKALKVLFRPPSNLSTVEMLRTGGYTSAYALYTGKDGSKQMKLIGTHRGNARMKMYKDVIPDADICWTLNTFKVKGSHEDADLFAYRCILVDLDDHTGTLPMEVVNALAHRMSKQMVREIDKGISDMLFLPNVVSSSGRGVHIIFSLTPFNAEFDKDRSAYRSAASVVCDEIQGWVERHPEYANFTIDRAHSCSPTGMCRGFGSWNMTVQNEIGGSFARTDVYTVKKPHYYGLAELAGQIEIPEVVAMPQEQEPMDVDHLFHVSRLNYVLSQYEDIKIPVGERDLKLYVIYCLMLKVYTMGFAKKEILEFNRTHCTVPMPEKELLRYLSASSRIKQDDGLRGYKFTNETLAERLELDLDDLNSHNNCYIKGSSKRERIATINREKKKECMRKAYAMRQDGCGYDEIAAELGITRQTASAWVKKIEKEVAAKEAAEWSQYERKTVVVAHVNSINEYKSKVENERKQGAADCAETDVFFISELMSSFAREKVQETLDRQGWKRDELISIHESMHIKNSPLSAFMPCRTGQHAPAFAA